MNNRISTLFYIVHQKNSELVRNYIIFYCITDITNDQTPSQGPMCIRIGSSAESLGDNSSRVMCYPLRTSSKLCCFRVFSSLLLKSKNSNFYIRTKLKNKINRKCWEAFTVIFSDQQMGATTTRPKRNLKNWQHR